MVLGIDLFSMVKESYKYYKYWENFKGEKIVILDERKNYKDDKNTLIENRYIIEGKIAEVLFLPPSFKLKDVKQYLVKREIKLLYASGSTEALDYSVGKKSKIHTRSVDEKYISFSSIENLELKENYDNSSDDIKLKSSI